MDRYQLRSSLLKIVVVTLMVSSWAFLSSILSTRPEQMDSDTLSSLARLPSSIEAVAIPKLQQNLPKVFTTAVKPVEPIGMEIMRFPCWDHVVQGRQTEAHFVRLTGLNCHGASADESDESVSVRNLSNDYNATIFPLQAPELTTDFIPLQRGKNEIVIRFEQGSSLVAQSQFTLIRN